MSKLVVKVQQLAHKLHKFGIPIIPRLLCLLLRLAFSTQLSPGSRIGQSTTLGYGGLGVIIHSQAELGDRCQIGANVIIGGNLQAGGVPKIGDDVFVGAGAVIIGDLSIGNGARIGANAVVLKDVPEFTTYVGVPAHRVIRVDGTST